MYHSVPSLSHPSSTPSNEYHRTIFLYSLMGGLAAKSVLDDRLFNLPLSPLFWKMVRGRKLSCADLSLVDPKLEQSLLRLAGLVERRRLLEANGEWSEAEKKRKMAEITLDGVSVEDLVLDFTYPGLPSLELVPGGASKGVTLENLDCYLEKIVDMTLGSGIKLQVEAFKEGFSRLLPLSALDCFEDHEMENLICGNAEPWGTDLDSILDSIKCDHGYSVTSPTVVNLVRFMTEMSPEEKSAFLKFITGSPRLPSGGLKALQPLLTVVRKDPDDPSQSPDYYLPSVMTCVNYLKLPDYSSLEVLKQKLTTAFREGQNSFLLS
eukprot:GILI01016771.1.p1 GENE.GILI01016771.1~~GILI01016771.1.p1  ORF type:complete len:344 (+),score=88.49 GILI01016771.1:67-1032(+)